MITRFITIPAVMAGLLALAACATTPTNHTNPSSTASSTEKSMPMEHENNHMMKDKHAAMKDGDKHKMMKDKHAAMMKGMPAECKAMMSKMHEKMEKMKSDGMDMAAMKEKMQSGEGMSEDHKKCHKLMHEKMHDKADASTD